jgi:hypothetical protein
MRPWMVRLSLLALVIAFTHPAWAAGLNDVFTFPHITYNQYFPTGKINGDGTGAQFLGMGDLTVAFRYRPDPEGGHPHRTGAPRLWLHPRTGDHGRQLAPQWDRVRRGDLGRPGGVPRLLALRYCPRLDHRRSAIERLVSRESKPTASAASGHGVAP